MTSSTHQRIEVTEQTTTPNLETQGNSEDNSQDMAEILELSDR